MGLEGQGAPGVSGGANRCRLDDGGYVLVALLIGLAIAGVWMSAMLPSWRQQMTREREAELIFRGEQYARAILFYYQRNSNTFPSSMDDLVSQHLLRRKWKDPITDDEFLPRVGCQVAGAPVGGPTGPGGRPAGPVGPGGVPIRGGPGPGGGGGPIIIGPGGGTGPRGGGGPPGGGGPGGGGPGGGGPGRGRSIFEPFIEVQDFQARGGAPAGGGVPPPTRGPSPAPTGGPGAQQPGRGSPSTPGTGQGQPTAGGICGVQSKSNKASIKIYNGQQEYDLWQFDINTARTLTQRNVAKLGGTPLTPGGVGVPVGPGGPRQGPGQTGPGGGPVIGGPGRGPGGGPAGPGRGPGGPGGPGGQGPFGPAQPGGPGRGRGEFEN